GRSRAARPWGTACRATLAEPVDRRALLQAGLPRARVPTMRHILPLQGHDAAPADQVHGPEGHLLLEDQQAGRGPCQGEVQHEGRRFVPRPLQGCARPFAARVHGGRPHWRVQRDALRVRLLRRQAEGHLAPGKDGRDAAGADGARRVAVPGTRPGRPTGRRRCRSCRPASKGPGVTR
ncbi:unnamed protein product, partial [Prorocentrum cordatum]